MINNSSQHKQRPISIWEVRRLLETPVQGASVDLTIDGSYLNGSISIERPSRLAKGLNCLNEFSIGAFSYSWSHVSPWVGSIGRYCSIASRIQFGEFEHPVDWLSTSGFTYEMEFLNSITSDYESRQFTPHHLPGGRITRPIRIENDVWIGAGAYIRGGVVLGNGCIVGAQAVVTKDVPPYAIVVGNPGRIVRYRFNPDIIAALERLSWWNYSYFDFKNVDSTNIEATIDRLEELIEGGLSRYQPPITHLEGNGESFTYAGVLVHDDVSDGYVPLEETGRRSIGKPPKYLEMDK